MMTRHRFTVPFGIVIVTFLLGSAIAPAGEADWPQWRGPDRDGHAAPQSLLQDWPEGGPSVRWQYGDAGIGYSAFAIQAKRLYTMGSKGSDCYTICLDTTTGERVWQTVTSRSANDNDYAHGWGGGPRSSPTVDGEYVYSLSDVGVLACLNASDGNMVWSVDYVNDFNGSIPKWGYSESVLIDGDRVIGTPGGDSFMIGLDKATGKVEWSSKEIKEAAQYVSPMKHEFEGVPFYLNAGKSGLLAFDVQSGEMLFRDSATGNEVAVIPTPVVFDSFIYHTSDYGAGNTLLELSIADQKLQATSIYHLSNKSMQNHHGGVVLVDGVIYGFTKSGGGEWMAQDMKSGDTLWTEKVRPNRSGSISYGDGRLYCYNDEEGSVNLIEPSRDGWKAHGKLILPEKTAIERGSGAIWAHPVIADGTLYLRDQDKIFAFDVSR